MGNLTPDQISSREKTLVAAFLLSMWAPLATGIAVILSRSTTQIADFIRRTVELIALGVSWRVFRFLHRGEPKDQALVDRWERIARLSVALALICSGIVMLVVAGSRLAGGFIPGGNVIPGLIIAGMGLAVNSWFWRRYSVLNREQFSSVIDSQRQLYCAKAVVDLCVVTALAVIAFIPDHALTRHTDILGSVAVAGYLVWSGVRAMRSPALPAVDKLPAGPAQGEQ